MRSRGVLHFAARRARRAACLPAAAVVLAAGPAVAAVLVVTSVADTGPGTLRAAIEAANAEPGSTIVVDGGGKSEIVVDTALPPLAARGTVLDGRGATLRQGVACTRTGGRAGCDGLVVTGPGIVVRDLAVAGFTLDGVAVLGRRARDVSLVRIAAVANGDDGIGVSAGAGPVAVEEAVLLDNGYRSKGKGLLAFDGARVRMVAAVVAGNRDGITASRGARLELDDVVVAGNWDKGIGASEARIDGHVVLVVASGQAAAGTPSGKAPNRDGVRAGLGARVFLVDSRVAASGDAGVAVLDRSRVELAGTVVEEGRGPRAVVAPGAELSEAGAVRRPGAAR